MGRCTRPVVWVNSWCALEAHDFTGKKHSRQTCFTSPGLNIWCRKRMGSNVFERSRVDLEVPQMCSTFLECLPLCWCSSTHTKNDTNLVLISQCFLNSSSPCSSAKPSCPLLWNLWSTKWPGNWPGQCRSPHLPRWFDPQSAVRCCRPLQSWVDLCCVGWWISNQQRSTGAWEYPSSNSKRMVHTVYSNVLFPFSPCTKNASFDGKTFWDNG